MSKIIPIITSAPIQYSFNHLDVYDAFNLVSQGKLEAPLVQNALEIVKNHSFLFSITNIETIFTAEKGQTVDTAEILIKSGKFPNAKIVKTPLLNGVSFSMKNLIPKEKFITMPQAEALSLARKAFLEQLYENNLNESFEDLILRMEKLTSLLKNTNDSVICISHSFYIKLFEIYTKDKSEFKNLETLIESFNSSQKPYEPLIGFDFEI